MVFKPETDEQERKIYVGGLNKDATDEAELKSFFASYGDIVDANIMREYEGRSRGFGFVLFDDATTVDKIIAAKKQQEFIINGSAVFVKRALPKVPGGKAVAPRSDFRKIFVGGLPSSIVEEDLHVYFEQFGRIIEVDLVKDRETNRVRGFAFVTFRDEDCADRCIQRRTHEICKKLCEVKRAQSKPKDDRDHPGPSPHQQPSAGATSSTTTTSGTLPMEEVNRLIQQAFVMGQQSVGSAPAPPSSTSSVLLQALLGQQPTPVPAAAPAPAPAPSPASGVLQIAQLLQSSGVDANALAAILKGDGGETKGVKDGGNQRYKPY